MKRPKVAHICISLLPSMNHIELLQYDATKGQFLRLDSEPFLCDPATRELLDEPAQFKGCIKRLYERNKIPLKSLTSLVLPSFFTRQYTLPEDVLGEDIETILISEAERFYVFKKIDPSVGFSPLRNGEMLYTAYPKEPLNQIRRCFGELKIPLVSIDCSYTATLRGLVAMNIVQQQIAEQSKWGLIIISDTNVFMAVLEGIQIEKTLEAPLPTEEEALIQEIKDDFSDFFGYEILTRMVVINNAYRIYSPTLVEQLGFQGNTEVFDQNDNTLASLKASEAPFPCSLEAIGGALIPFIPDVPVLELGDPNAVEYLEDTSRKNKIALIAGVAGVLLFLLQFGVTNLLHSLTETQSKANAQLQTEINQYISSLSILSDIKRKYYVKQVVAQNAKVNNVLIKLSQNLPQDAWLQEVNLNALSDLSGIKLLIQGSALASEPLTTYIQALNSDLPNAPLTPVIVPKTDGNQRYFEYTLSNGVTTGASAIPSAGGIIR